MKRLWLGLILIFVLSTCSKLGTEKNMDKLSTPYSTKGESNGPLGYSKDEDAKKSDVSENKTVQQNANTDANDNATSEKKIIKAGSIEYKVKDLKDIEKNVNANVKKFDGYVANLENYQYYIFMQVKIPSEKLDEFLTAANSFGTILTKTITAKDVTKEYYDTETRIENKRISVKRLRDYLAAAKSVDDALKVEDRLTRVTEELELLEGDIKNLSSLVAFSTIDLKFTLPNISPDQDRKWPSLKNQFGDLWNFIVWFVNVIFFGIIYTILVASVLVLIAALVYYLTFGKLGLVKRLFRRLSGKKLK
jgi:Domain of unknown function (DUF4349)